MTVEIDIGQSFFIFIRIVFLSPTLKVDTSNIHLNTYLYMLISKCSDVYFLFDHPRSREELILPFSLFT